MTKPNMAYFALDGSYGDATGIVFIDVSKFTGDDWEMIYSATDEERTWIAEAIAQNYDAISMRAAKPQ